MDGAGYEVAVVGAPGVRGGAGGGQIGAGFVEVQDEWVGCEGMESGVNHVLKTAMAG
ncbi:hypothetical protein GCM10020220_068850 [Nonomuraea rubra]